MEVGVSVSSSQCSSASPDRIRIRALTIGVCVLLPRVKEEERTPMIRSVNFLLTLAAVVAATLLVTPLPAVAETEAPNSPSVTPLEVERAPVGVAALAPNAVCGATTAVAPATDIDPECFRECQREYQRCGASATTRSERQWCSSEHSDCEHNCIYGSGCDGTYPWWFCATTFAHEVPGTTEHRPAAKDSETPRTPKPPSAGAPQYDAQRPRLPQPQLF